ncbi:uncharacterized protein [Setaria viridis]|uniref:Uncharacterized protein n=1 Tax=Setaria viridis TaxID=4556 RepID=A0A4U6UHA4_SETVI|nr:uncharacterized protein LOC117857071 isoform X1 [Setaria viridis]TKW14074.1 hypothetical protein SEVIR_5G143600v2 [Setaria viridis]
MAAASVWLLQLPPPALHNSLSHPSNQPSSACPPLHKKPRGDLLCCASSGASSSVVAKEQEEAVAAPSEEGYEPALLSYKDDPNFRGCRGCGREELERGCNGEGRIQGGIAAVPGFGWWPIKAYRPCPGFVASGGRYRRQGQSMDDVASGRGKKVSPAKKKYLRESVVLRRTQIAEEKALHLSDHEVCPQEVPQ